MDIWVMCADSESGDHYHACAIWDHQPTREEINRIKIQLDAMEGFSELEEGDSPSDFGDDPSTFIRVDGRWYRSFVYEKINKVSIGE